MELGGSGPEEGEGGKGVMESVERFVEELVAYCWCTVALKKMRILVLRLSSEMFKR